MQEKRPIRRDPLLKGTRRLIKFDPRLALSASAGADLLMELWDVSTQATDGGSSGDGQGTDLLQQAAVVRDQFGIDGSGQTVAVIDSGIAYDHIALGEGYGPGYRVVGGYDFAESDTNPYDDAPGGYHGTHVSGLLAGQSQDFQGIASDVDLVSLRVLDDNGRSNLDWIEDALSWVHDNQFAFENPITTVNLSLGGILPSEIGAEIQLQLEDELQQLKADGILVLAAAGNAFDADLPQQLAYPALSDAVTAVGSIGNDGQLSEFSQRTDGILVAPGERITSSVPDHVLGIDGDIDDFLHSSGTSMATPQISGASVLVREALQSAGLPHDADSITGHLRSTADVATDPVTGIEYRQVNLLRAVQSILGDGNGEGEGGVTSAPVEQSIVDLGETSLETRLVETNQFHRVEASQDGTFSIALGDSTQSAQTLTVLNETGAEIYKDILEVGGQADLEVVAGQRLDFRIESTGNDSVTLSLANLVTRDGRQISYSGAAGAEAVDLDLTSGALRFSQFSYEFDPAGIEQIRLQTGGGNDSVNVLGSAAAETLNLRLGETIIKNASIEVQIADAEIVDFRGGGGPDRAYFYDSSGADTLTARPGSAELVGGGYSHTVSEVSGVYVRGVAGGNDTAFLYDSTSDDTLAIRPDFTSLRGGGYTSIVFGFDRVNAYGTAGGFDSADLYDSQGDDRLSANARSAFISGPGFYSQARGFESVTGHATAGGNDHATIYADSADQRFHHVGDLYQLDAGQDAVRAARGFEISETFLNGNQIVISPLSVAPSLDRLEIPLDEAVAVERSSSDLDPIAELEAEKIERIASYLPGDIDESRERALLDDLFAEL